jgi:hypothetical protein
MHVPLIKSQYFLAVDFQKLKFLEAPASKITEPSAAKFGMTTSKGACSGPIQG